MIWSSSRAANARRSLRGAGDQQRDLAEYRHRLRPLGGRRGGLGLLYDEVIFVIEGCFELKANGELYRVKPGQLLWIPEGTELVYGGHALFGYVVHPGDWKQRHGLA